MSDSARAALYLSPKQVEDTYNIPITTLEKWRSRRIGPPYYKCGKHIRYRPGDVVKWIESRRVVTG